MAATAYASASVNYATSAGTATSASSATNATNTTNINTLADNSSNAARFILFSDAATGNQRAKTNTGLKYNPSSNTITATLAGNATTATTATKVNNQLTLKFDTGTTENTNLYTYDGSAAKTIDIKAGSNVSFTKTGSTVTINSTDTNTVYTHPSYTAYASGLYKITTNTLGHVTGATTVVKSDITALGIPSQDTTYSTGTLNDLTVGTNTTGKLQTAKLLNDWINGKGYITSYTNTTYTAGSGLTLSGTQFSLPVTVSGSGTYVQSVAQNTNGISVTLGTPPNTNTTYSAMSVSRGTSRYSYFFENYEGRLFKTNNSILCWRFNIRN